MFRRKRARLEPEDPRIAAYDRKPDGAKQLAAADADPSPIIDAADAEAIADEPFF